MLKDALPSPDPQGVMVSSLSAELAGQGSPLNNNNSISARGRRRASSMPQNETTQQQGRARVVCSLVERCVRRRKAKQGTSSGLTTGSLEAARQELVREGGISSIVQKSGATFNRRAV